MTQAIGSDLNRDRALRLLANDIPNEQVASALGITPSAISQYLSEDDFISRLTELRYKRLSRTSSLDEKYDEIEEWLLKKLKDTLTYLYKPMEIARVLSLINAAKRRAAPMLEQPASLKNVVPLSIPQHLIQIFSQHSKIEVNIHNQVVKAGDQSLITIQSSNVEKLAQLTTNPGIIDVSSTPSNGGPTP